MLDLTRKAPVIGRPPVGVFMVWPDFAPPDRAIARESRTALAAVMMIAAEMAASQPPIAGDTALEDYFARGNNLRMHRIRVKTMAGAIITAELRACHRCGCSEDRACTPPCAWVAADLCSACAPKIGAVN